MKTGKTPFEILKENFDQFQTWKSDFFLENRGNLILKISTCAVRLINTVFVGIICIYFIDLIYDFMNFHLPSLLKLILLYVAPGSVLSMFLMKKVIWQLDLLWSMILFVCLAVFAMLGTGIQLKVGLTLRKND